ncbi:response regulator [Planctomycetota bacterium]
MGSNSNPLGDKVVLVVDDEQEILDTIEDLLVDEVGDLDFATGYEKARSLLDSKAYDLAVFDLMGVRGLDLVRDYSRTVDTIVLTGQSVRPATVNWILEHNVKAFLPKPEMTDLERCLRIVVTSPKSVELWNLWMKAKARAEAAGENAAL